MEEAVFSSKIGNLKIVESEKGICEISFCDEPVHSSSSSLIQKTIQQLQEYFEGTRKEFTIPLDIQGTEFQQKVYHALLRIPYGKTWSYQQLAKEVGNKRACRAVGNANHRNKIVIIIPCHRVIGSNGKLVGYAGGLDKKETLLQLERDS